MSKRKLSLRSLIEFRGGATKSPVVAERDSTGRLTKAVVERVKLLGPTSANRNPDGTTNVYPLEARRKALPLYEGARVNVDHRRPHEPRNQPRSIRDRVGRIRRAVAEADGTFGDLVLNPRHEMAEAILWAAEHDPESLGMSHAAHGKGLVEGSNCVLQEITTVESVDVVSDPATTRGLFEARTTPEGTPMDLKALMAILDGEGDDAAKLAAIREACAAEEEQPEEDAPEEGDEPTAEDAKAKAPAKKGELVGAGATESRRPRGGKALEEALRRIDELEVAEAGRERRALVDRLLTESRLPREAITDTFRDTLSAATDEKAIKALIEDRRGVYGGGRPTSRDPGRQPAGTSSGAGTTPPPFKSIDVSRYGTRSGKETR